MFEIDGKFYEVNTKHPIYQALSEIERVYEDEGMTKEEAACGASFMFVCSGKRGKGKKGSKEFRMWKRFSGRLFGFTDPQLESIVFRTLAIDEEILRECAEADEYLGLN